MTNKDTANNNIVSKVLDAEINDLLQLTLKQKEQLKLAKTATKKVYINKKIEKNTNLLIKYLASAEKLRNKSKSSDHIKEEKEIIV